MFQDGARLLRLQKGMTSGERKAYLWRMNNRDKVIEKVELSDEFEPTTFAEIHKRFIRNSNKNKSANRFRANKDNKTDK